MTELFTDALARTLLNSLWEGAAVALVLAVVLCFLSSSRARYAAGCVAILVVLTGLLVTFIQLAPPLRFHPELAGVWHAVPLPPNSPLPDISPSDPRHGRYMTWIVPVWMAGVLLFYVRGVMGWIAAAHLRRKGTCLAPAVWRERLTGLKTQLQLSRPVIVMESCLAEVPVVIGLVRPVILIPVGLLTGFPVAQVEAILLHELAHIRRHDYLVNLLQVITEGLLFYHPAVWWISRVIRDERENCCDDLVVEVTGAALEYAAALTALENLRPNLAPVLAATDGNLMKRVRRLPGRGEPRFAAAMPVFTAGVLTVTAVTAMVGLQFGSGARRVNAPAPMTNHIGEKQLIAQDKPPAPDVFSDSQPYGQQTPQPDKILLERAVQDIEQGQFQYARLTLNTLINTYESSPYLKQAKLAIAESWYREGGVHGLAQAEIEYKDFIRFYPGTEEAKEAEAMLSRLAPKAILRFDRWLIEDVAYIISDAEREAARRLTTDDERQEFIEQFWLRRDPTPGTSRNEFKEEHYRRISYANDHFGDSNIAGWKTDRGRIYIPVRSAR